MTLTTTEATTRRLYVGLWVLSGVSLGGLIAVGRPLVGVGAFVACVVAAVGLVWRYEGPLFDERDRRVRNGASARTLRIVGIGSAVVFPALTALWALGVVEWPLWLTPVALFVAVLAFVHVGSLLYETAGYA